MKKRLRTIVILGVIAGLAWFAWTLATSKDNNTRLADHALSDFAVEDTAKITKLILSDTEGNKGITLVREGGGWKSETGECIQQHLVQTMLETIRRIKVKSPVNSGAIQTVNSKLTAHHRKVEIFLDGELHKIWYVGNPTPDHYGTYMLLKDPELGKSPEPFIMFMPGHNGSLQSRFITNPLEFECTGVFNYNVLDIKSVEVIQPDSSQHNFKIVANGKNNFSMFTNNKALTGFDTSRVRDYLLCYEKVHFENHNYEYKDKDIDSLKKVTPMYIIEVRNKKNEQNRIVIYKRRYNFEKIGLDGNLIEWDQDRCWVFLNDGRLVVGQYFVFDRLLQNKDWFLAKPTTNSNEILN